MAVSLDNLAAAVSAEDAEIASLATDSADSFAALKALIDSLSAGTISQAQVDALQAAVEGHSASLTALDDAAKAANPTPPAA